jgi:KipI family sensor histidine kinase inhibitor
MTAVRGAPAAIVRRFGEHAFEIVPAPTPGETPLDDAAAATWARRIAAALAGVPGVSEALAGYGVVVALTPAGVDEAIRAAIGARLARLAQPSDDAAGAPRTHVFRAIYDGPDLRTVAEARGMSIDEVVGRHARASYEAEIVGFLPGFAYLGGLDARLETPRRATPRPRVPAGSIAIAGLRTAIYPLASPGGWSLLGRIDGPPLFDPARSPASLLRAGDRVRFEVAEVAPDRATEPASRLGGARAPVEPHVAEVRRGLVVERVGPLATVQDAGRPGQASAAVPASGPLDREAFARAVAAVGGRGELDAALELPRLGATFRAIGAVTYSIDGEPARRVRDGERVEVARSAAAVRYLAVAGGLDVPRVLGARATLVLAGLGGLEGRPLVRGDVLAIGEAPSAPTSGFAADTALPIGGALELEVHPDAPAQAIAALALASFRVDARSDRVGVRLEGATLPGGVALARSRPLVVGAVQLPPDGRPLVIGPDGPTVGGYALLGVLRSSSLARLGRTPPGAGVTLRGTG